MTKEHANELKVGFVVLVCLILGMGVALSLSDWETWFEPTNTLTFKVPYRAGIGGIKAGWPVTIGGVTVGNVERIYLKLEEIDPRDVEDELPTEPAEPQADQEQQPQTPPQPLDDSGLRTYSYFTFIVPGKYLLREDCKLTPAGQLIGGAGELVILDLGRGELLQDGQEVFRKSLGGSSMAAVMDTVQEAVANIRKITEDFKEVSAKARETVNLAKPKLETIVDNFQTASENFKELSQKSKETVSLSKPQLEKIISNIHAASVEMKAGMREIRWNPWRLLHNPTDRELRTQNLLTAARAFSSGAADVDASVAKLEGLLAARDDSVTTDDPQVQQMVEELRATMVKFSQAADTFFKRLGTQK